MGHAVINLRKIEYLRGLPQPEAEELARYSEFRHLPDGTPAFRQGEHLPGVFVVISGILKVYRADGRGKIQVLDMLEPGTCVGEVQVFDGGTAASGAEAYGDTEVMLIPAEALRRLLRRDPAMAEVIIQHFASKVRHLISLVETLSLHSVPERVAQLLLDRHIANPGRSLVEFDETQEELAQCIGASREAFSRALRLLMDLGLIQSTFPVVRILDMQKLERYTRG
jgi:CRP/FNR family transcriptional regulator, dissimilatory nitrate respiration regulator